MHSTDHLDTTPFFRSSLCIGILYYLDAYKLTQPSMQLVFTKCNSSSFNFPGVLDTKKRRQLCVQLANPVARSMSSLVSVLGDEEEHTWRRCGVRVIYTKRTEGGAKAASRRDIRIHISFRLSLIASFTSLTYSSKARRESTRDFLVSRTSTL